MICGLEKNGSTKCALDATKNEAFTQKPFSDLIYESHSKGQDYYIARVHCVGPDNFPSFYCYDARHLCKYIFEMVISTEGRKIRIKNFKDPIHSKDISEINFFRMRFDSDTPLRAEYAGNHISFLESNVFRSKMFFQEDALDALSVNFQFKSGEKSRIIPRRKFATFFCLLLIMLIFGTLAYFGIKIAKQHFKKEQPIKKPGKTAAPVKSEVPAKIKPVVNKNKVKKNLPKNVELPRYKEYVGRI
ncbi:hypothetical protein NUSPORA_01635 [Nucleospora cyclopteri]